MLQSQEGQYHVFDSDDDDEEDEGEDFEDLHTANVRVAIEERWDIPVTAQGEFDVTALQVDEAQKAQVAQLKQGSPEWLRARWGRLTASNFGAAAGYHLPGARQKLLQAMLWPESHAALTGFAARAAAHGSAQESVARDLYIAHRRYIVQDGLQDVWETGLLVSTKHGWMGASPDFLFTEVVAEPGSGAEPGTATVLKQYTISNAKARDAAAAAAAAVPASAAAAAAAAEAVVSRGCGEIKCPFSNRLYSDNPKHAPTGGFPAYYYAQIQGLMAQEDLGFCDAVVHVRHVTEVRRFPRNRVYYDLDLFPKLHAFYFQDFVPRLNARLKGRLRRGQVDPIMPLVFRGHGVLDKALDDLYAKALEAAAAAVVVENEKPV